MFEVRQEENIQTWNVSDEELIRIFWDNKNDSKKAKTYLLNHLSWKAKN